MELGSTLLSNDSLSVNINAMGTVLYVGDSSTERLRGGCLWPHCFSGTMGGALSGAARLLPVHQHLCLSPLKKARHAQASLKQPLFHTAFLMFALYTDGSWGRHTLSYTM